MKQSILIFLAVFSLERAVAQMQNSPFHKILIFTDTLVFDSEKNVVTFNNEPHVYFEYSGEEQICEIRLYPKEFDDIGTVRLMASPDYELLDSLYLIGNEYFRGRIRFRNLSQSDFLKLIFSYHGQSSAESQLTMIPVLPFTRTFADLYSDDMELFIGEEKIFELTSNHIQNIRVNNIWSGDEPVNFRLTFENGRLYLHLLSKVLGKQTLHLELQTIKPFIDGNGQLQYDLPVINRTLTVKESRLRFLDTGVEDIIIDSDNREGILIQLESNPYFSLQKTYRIEDREEPGGPLVAELFTVNYLNNGRILCRLRPYSLHRKSDGYLYIKENDAARFILNVNIIPKTTIEKMSLLREGGDWTNDMSVYPGETVQIRLEGKSLHKGVFLFEGLTYQSGDTLVKNENLALFRLRVPFRFSQNTIPIYINNIKTGLSLSVKEYQRPRNFDFIYIESNGWKRSLEELGTVVMAQNVIQDVTISFDRDKIDSEGRLFGKQILQVVVTVRGKNNELVEMVNLDNVEVCPGTTSIRHAYYSDRNCLNGSISLNRYLLKKTYDLEEWSRIIIEIKHKKESHGGEGFVKNLDIILERSWRFDIEVSFPAGLLTFGGDDPGNLTGISMAMIGQFSFYEKNRINRYKPYKVGAGFIALDVFNFSENSESRDVAIVVLGSLYPTRRDTKLTFPLYFGAGYKLINEQFFFMIGPGIRVSL